MERSFLIAVYGTFGHPNGFTQSLYGKDHSGVGDKIKAFDISTTAIKLFNDTTMYRLRKEKVGGQRVISLSKYAYAKEKNSSRGGTFVGVGVLSVNELIDVSLCLNALNTFLSKLMSNPNNIQEGRIMVSHAKEYTLPDMKLFTPLMNCASEPIEDVKFGDSGEELLIYSESVSEKNALIKLIVDGGLELLSDYDSIYFTDSEDISKYTYDKRIIEVVDEALLQNKLSVIKQRRQKECGEIIENANAWVGACKESLKNRKEKLNELRKTHQENERRLKAFQEENEKINSEAEKAFQEIEKISENLIRPDSIPKNSQIKKIKGELLNITRTISEKMGSGDAFKLDRIEIPKPPVKRRSKLPINSPKTYKGGYLEPVDVDYTDKQSTSKKDLFLVVILFLSILVLGGGVYYWFSKKETNKVEESSMERDAQLPVQYTDSIGELTPKPNAELTENDLKSLNKTLSQAGKNISADSVVEVIFEKNPKEISSYYKNQKEIYKKLLIKMNEYLFSGDVLTDAKLEKIPCYKE